MKQVQNICVGLAENRKRFQRRFREMVENREQFQNICVGLAENRERFQRRFREMAENREQSQNICVGLTENREHFQRRFRDMVENREQFQGRFTELMENGTVSSTCTEMVEKVTQFYSCCIQLHATPTYFFVAIASISVYDFIGYLKDRIFFFFV